MRFAERLEVVLSVINLASVIWANIEEARWNRIRRQLDALALAEKKR